MSKLQTFVREKMEQLLLVWLIEKQLMGTAEMDFIICEKAQAIYTDWLQQTPTTSLDEAQKD